MIGNCRVDEAIKKGGQDIARHPDSDGLDEDREVPATRMHRRSDETIFLCVCDTIDSLLILRPLIVRLRICVGRSCGIHG